MTYLTVTVLIILIKFIWGSVLVFIDRPPPRTQESKIPLPSHVRDINLRTQFYFYFNNPSTPISTPHFHPPLTKDRGPSKYFLFPRRRTRRKALTEYGFCQSGLVVVIGSFPNMTGTVSDLPSRTPSL